MVTNVKQMLEAANAVVPKITPDQARDLVRKGNTLVVDVRDAPEVAVSGKVAGAVHVSRGMLEFRADPESPYHDKNFDKEKSVILYCASGGRAALAGKLLKDMGYDNVYNVGSFKDWTGAAALSNSIAGSADLLTVSQLQQRILFLILKAVAVGRWSDHRI
jgi:rhodanese-related sulfurtransferase